MPTTSASATTSSGPSNLLLATLEATSLSPLEPLASVAHRTMAKVPINDPKHWRDRAEEARTVADELTDPDAKRRMLRIADDYEELAKRAERRLAAKNRE